MKKHIKYKEKSIITQTAFRVSVVFLAAIVVLTVIFAVFAGSYMKDNILSGEREQISTIADSVNNDIDSLTNPMVSLGAYNSALRLMSWYGDIYTKEWMQDIRNVDVFLTNVNMFNDYIIDIVLIQPDSTVVYSMKDRLKSGYDYVNQKWFQKAMENDGIIKYAFHHNADHFYSERLPYTLSAVHPVYRQGTLAGYVMFECDLSRIADFFREKEDGESGYILLDDEGKCIFDYRNQREEQAELETSVYGNVSKGNKEFKYNRNLYLACQVPACGWTVLSEYPYSIISRPVVLLLVVVAFILFITISLLIFISLHNARKIRKPFDALIDRIVSYDGTNGEDPESFESAPKELYIIRTKFEEMAGKINTLISDVYLAELSRKEMELEAMTNQINPHFLYNVFQLIQTEAVMADNRNIEEMIQALSKMMRYTMERKRDRVKIEEELQYIRNYLMFYKERFGSLFTYEIQCGEELLEYKTIKFILQPVVENCFKHGFKDLKAGGRICINVKSRGNDIVFTVWDNGRGIKQQRLAEVREELNGNITENGIGIVNTNSRLKLVYGISYGITLESEEGEFTLVTICIKGQKE